MIFPIVFVDFELRNRAMLHRHTRRVHRLCRARNQRVPVMQRLAVPQKRVGTGFGQPIEVPLDVLHRQRDAFRDELMPDLVLAAPACGVVEQPAGHAGQCHLAGFVVLQLVQTAFATAIPVSSWV